MAWVEIRNPRTAAVRKAPAPAATTAKVCVLCGEQFSEFGNNPYPLATLDEGECCDRCNGARVLPARSACAADRMTTAKA
jgi:hypothetical protein